MGLAGSPASIARGLKTNFVNTYRAKLRGPSSRLAEVMDLTPQSDGAFEDYFYYLSAPHPVRTNKGEGPPDKGFGGRAFRVVNEDWKLKISWNENDEQDDQTGGLVNQARQGGRNFAILPERVFFQIITASTDADLLPAVPDAADGAALYSATNGAGDDRFGATDGNDISGLTLTTSADIRSAIYQAGEQFGQFQDTEGQPLYPDELVDTFDLMVIFNRENLQLFNEAFVQRSVFIDNTAGDAAAAPSNVILDAGHRIRPWPSQRITDNQIYTFLMQEEIKAVFMQTRMPLRDNIQDFVNSDRTRDTDVKAVQWKMRAGFGVAGDPYMTVRLRT